MIYRIKISKGKGSKPFNSVWTRPGTWRGIVGCELCDIMVQLGFKAPDVRNFNRRARFYFTEKGWDTFGRQVCAIATKRGLNPKVVRKKNPKRSDVIYADGYQVAILASDE